MEESYKKFLEKNKDVIDRLNFFIKKNKGNIRSIIVSTELIGYLVYLETGKFDEDLEDVEYYQGVRMIVDPFLPSEKINVVVTNNDFSFNVPCFCGIFNDDPHEFYF